MRLKLALQKSGRLSEKSLGIISEAGISLTNGAGKLVSKAGNFPLEVMYLRDDDIPGCVSDGVADVGIAGENIVTEKNRPLETVEKLGFARCRLSLAVDRSVDYRGTQFFEGKRIATSYPLILGRFLRENDINAEIHEINGSVEIAPAIGFSDAVFDIVSTGSTLMGNGLKEAETVMRSQAVMVACRELSDNKRKILGDLLFRLRAVLKAKNNKYILLNAPNEKLDTIADILPGMKSPTVMPLAKQGWSSVHSVVSEEEFWEVIDRLLDAGAQGILVIPIEKMIV